MIQRHRLLVLTMILFGALALVLSGCGTNGPKSVKGTVVAVDAAAKTFSIQGTDGKKYDFKAGSGVDLAHVKEHMDEKAQIEVTYTGSTPPYDASAAH